VRSRAPIERATSLASFRRTFAVAPRRLFPVRTQKPALYCNGTFPAGAVGPRAIGQMASGIAHDINNAISPVAVYTQSLIEHEPDLPPDIRDLKLVGRVVKDVAATVGRMRALCGHSATREEVVPIPGKVAKGGSYPRAPNRRRRYRRRANCRRIRSGRATS
jgi:hypothetical protein